MDVSGELADLVVKQRLLQNRLVKALEVASTLELRLLSELSTVEEDGRERLGALVDGFCWVLARRATALVEVEDWVGDETERLVWEALSSLAWEEVGTGFDRLCVEGRLWDMRHEDHALDVAKYYDGLSEWNPGHTVILPMAQAISRNVARRTELTLHGEALRAANEAKSIDLMKDAVDARYQAVLDARRSGGAPTWRRTVELVAATATKGPVASVERQRGVMMGLTRIDNLMGGLRPGQLCFVAARPSHGKTSLIVHWAIEAAMAGKSVALISMEMTEQQIARMCLARISNVDHAQIRRGLESEEHIAAVTDARIELDRLPIHVHGTGKLELKALKAMCRELALSRGVQVVFIDYAQLIDDSDTRRSDGRSAEGSVITGALKGLATELDIGVCAAAQLNREVEKRQHGRNPKPMMSDLREWGTIEADADVILFVHREWMYSKNQAHYAWNTIVLGKNREGPTGEDTVLFDPRVVRFSDLLPDEVDPADAAAIAGLVEPPPQQGLYQQGATDGNQD